MRRIKLFVCLAIMTSLVVGTTVPAFSINSDGSITMQEFIDMEANSAAPGYEEAARRDAKRFVQNYYADAAIEEAKYNAALGISSSPATAAPVPSQPAVVAPTPVISTNQAAQIQAAQQKALAANPGTDPATIYLQTLQANGYTLDATGKIIPIAK